MMTRYLIAAALVLAIPQAAFADSVIQELARHPTWLKLLKYESGGLAGDQYLSAVVSPDFFIAADGPSNPENELRSTMAALAKHLEGDPDDHAQCRFPARYQWLRSRGLLANSVKHECPGFNGWIFGDATDSISIVFATGYLGNPASYFGHTLLKFNSSQQRNTSDLLDVTVNYGAVIPPGVGPVSYIFNGATGGFSAGFSHIEYYFHDYNYGELELRNLWEYQLDLEPDEVRFVMAHAWELLGREFTYYFFRKNCAYRMAEVVEIVDGIDVIPRRRPWTVPQVIVGKADRLEREGRPLIASQRFHASRQSVFFHAYGNLDASERVALKSLILDESGDDALVDLPEQSQARVVDAAIDYYSYLMPKDEPADSELSRKYRAMLALRFALPRGRRSPVPEPRSGPETDRNPGYVSLGLVDYSGEQGVGGSLRVRPAYYDPLDATISHVPNSELSLGDIILDFGDGEVRLRQAKLFRVEAVNSSMSGLPGDSGRSWILGLGAVEQYPGCDDCLVARFEGDIGRSTQAPGNSTVGFYVGGALQDNRNDFGNAFARVSGYLNSDLGERVRVRARYELRYHIDSARDLEDVISVEGRWALARNWDIRLEWRKNRTRSARLALGYYW